MRLDLWLSQNQKISRSLAQKWIKSGCVWLDEEVLLKPAYEVSEGDDISVDPPEVKKLDINPVDLKLKIHFQDEHLAVIYKPAGLVTHPGAGEHETTLVHGLLFALDHLSGIGGVERPGIVHRLDKETEGLMLVAKDDPTHQALSEAIAERKVVRKYLAEVAGRVKQESGTLETLMGRHPKDRKKRAVLHTGGKKAITHYHVMEYRPKTTLVECTLETGRTHQIRVHMQHLGNPVMGDPVYSSKKGTRQHLCAYRLEFTHPVSRQKMAFQITPSSFKVSI